jgi:hypothetical protein
MTVERLARRVLVHPQQSADLQVPIQHSEELLGRELGIRDGEAALGIFLAQIRGELADHARAAGPIGKGGQLGVAGCFATSRRWRARLDGCVTGRRNAGDVKGLSGFPRDDSGTCNGVNKL